jgi:hypothetical protein
MACRSIISRELLVRARQPGTYRVRWLAAGLALAVLLPAWLQAFPNPALLGRHLFTWLSVLALAGSLLEGARQTAHCLSQERREGTLGLLFLTELSGWDVVLGKLVVASLSSACSLLAVMPVLGLPLLTGGVSGGEFARMTLVLLAALFFAQSVGLWVSSRSQDDMRSLLVSLGLVAALAALLPLADLLLQHGRLTPGTARLSLASPGLAFHLAFDGAYQRAPGVFWLTLGVMQALAWGLLLAATIHLRHSSHAEAAPPHLGGAESEGPAPLSRSLGQVRGGSATSPCPEKPSRTGASEGSAPVRSTSKGRDRRAVMDADPIRWLARRQGGVPWWIWLLVAAAATAPLGRLFFTWTFPGVSAPMLGWGLPGFVHQAAFFVLRLLVALVAVRFFVHARRTGELELLLCTSLERAAILRGHRRACWQVVFWPLLAVTLLEQFIPFGVWLRLQPEWTPSVALGTRLAATGFGWLLECLGLLADAAALIWFGAWTALQARNLAEAVGRSLFLVVVLPALLEGIFWAISGLGRPAWTPFSSGTSWWLGQALGVGADFWLGPLAIWLAKDLFFIWYARRRLRAAVCGEPAPQI